MAYNVDANIAGKYLIYKDLPLVREGNMIYYGDMQDAYVLSLMILSYKTVSTGGGKTVEIPDGILGQIWSTDQNLPDTERMVRQFLDKQGLAAAFDFGISQLERFNKKKK